MTTADLEAGKARTYGHWRKPRSPGLPRLGTVGTLIALTLLVFTVLLQARFGLLGGLFGLLLTLVAVAPMFSVNKAGRNGWHRLGARLAWRLSQHQRRHIYSSALTSALAFGQCKLPGLLAASQLLQFFDAYGNPFTVTHVPAANHYTILLRAEPEGSQLVDQSTVDTWVGHYGLWLRDMCHEPGLVAASVTVESAPDPGFRLQAEVDRLVTAGAPQLSRQVLQEAATTYPKGGAQINAHIALTFSAKRSKGEVLAQQARKGKASTVRNQEEMGSLLGTRLSGILRSLLMTGAGKVRPMSPAEVAEYVRVAFDPTSGDAFAQSRTSEQPETVEWDNAGPAAAVEGWASYQHDGGTSVTWQMVAPPAGLVQSDCLRPLMAVTEEALRKRVTIQYRPHDAASAASLADRDVRTAQNRIVSGRDAKAHETAELRAALAAAQEEASGAGITRFSLLVTATVADPAQLPMASETLIHQARSSRIDLRPCYGTQAASFTAALGVGVVLSAHVNVPSLVSENI